MTETRKRLLDLQLQTIVRYNDLVQSNSERGFSLIVSLISVAIAFMAIVVPLITSLHSMRPMATKFFILSSVFFLFCAVDGIVYLLGLINFDKEELKNKNDWETTRLDTIQDRVNSVYGKLKENKGITFEEINDIYNQGTQFKEDSDKRQAEINKKPATKILNLLHKLFFGFFFAGLAFLVVFLIQTLFC